MTNKELAKDYFDRHHSSNECHITSDGRVFHTAGAAQGFAGGLKNDKVESFKREQTTTVAEPKNEIVDLEGRFKNRVDALTLKGYERKDDQFIHENGISISADDVHNLSDDKFTTATTEKPVLTLADFEGFNEKTDYTTAKALVKKLGLKPASNKQDDVNAAINAELAKLNTSK
ncbi:hypothetical protein [Flavobacterium sp.]|uniref:hypothetical protein n=1 Tax=Flavobacterium sp. TaxID=239 RepID=UPI0026278CC4|nr:hypothetical protein [Flavobacterium sp.]